MTEPPKNVDPNKTHALKGKTWNQFSESIKHRTPKSNKDILVKEMPDGYQVELKDRKTAILPLDLGAGQIEWVAWTCVEADMAIFRIIRDVGHEGLDIPPEMLGSCEPGSLQVVSAMPVGGLAVVSAEVVDQARVQWSMAALPGIAAPLSVRVVIEGVRLGMPEIWPRTDERTARRNRLFWTSAHQGGSVHDLQPEVDHEWPASRGEGE